MANKLSPELETGDDDSAAGPPSASAEADAAAELELLEEREQWRDESLEQTRAGLKA